MRRLVLTDVKSFNYKGKQTGHYFSLAKNYISLFSNVCQVKIAGGPIYKTGFSSDQLLLLPKDNVYNGNFINNKLASMRNMISLMRQTTREDIIILQMAGATTTLLALLLFGRSNRKIYSIQYDLAAINSSIKRIIFKLAKRKLAGIICPTTSIGEKLGLPYCVVPDYIYTDSNNIQEPIPFSERKYDFCMIGRIVPEKGITEAAHWLATTGKKVIIAGNPSTTAITDELKEISNSNPNIEVDLGFIEEDKLYHYIRNSKYSLMNYQGVYTSRSSGIVLDSIFNGTPVVGHKCFALQFIEDENIGLLYNNISDIDLSITTSQQTWEDINKNIIQYRIKNKSYKDTLVSFLKI